MENNQAFLMNNTGNTAWQIIARIIVSAIILGITAFFTPSFSINSIWSLALTAIILTVIDSLITKFTGLYAIPFGKGLAGFVLAIITLYMAQYFVTGYSISWPATIIGALIYGIVDYFIPSKREM